MKDVNDTYEFLCSIDEPTDEDLRAIDAEEQDDDALLMAA